MMEERIMKKYLFIFAALSACLAVSCNKGISTEETVNNDETPQAIMKTVTITATINDGIDELTKTSYSNTGVFSWTAGDQITVLGDDYNLYTFTANSTGATSTFTGTMPDGVGLGDRAHFPADAGHDVDGYKFCIPSSKDISAHPSADIPMVGEKAGTIYNFAHCCGATQLIIDNIPSKFVKLQISISHPSLKLSGTYDIFTSGGYYRWNPVATEVAAEKTFIRKVAVSDNKASIYIPYASEGDWWGTNTLSVIGYDSESNPTTLVSGKDMKSIGTVARAHIKPLKPLALNKLAFIDWSDAGVASYTVSYGGSSMRILDWKGYSDDYYVYLQFRINKAKIAYDDGLSTYDSSDASYIYVGFDLNPSTGTSASGGIQGSVWDALAFVRPFTGSTKGTIEFKDGDDPSSYFQNPVGSSTGKKVTTRGYIDGDNAYVAIAIPRSILGSPSSGSTIDIQAAMNYYYTDTGTLTLK